MALLDKLKQFLQNKKLGIVYDVDPSNITDRGGTFLELRILEATTQYEKDISQMPLEKSKMFNDNFRIKPKKLSMKVVITDYRSGLISLGRLSSTSEVQDRLDLFERINDQGLMCDIQTITRFYKNMQLVNYSFTEDPQNQGRQLIVDMQWEEMLLFDIVTKQDSKSIKLINDGKFVNANIVKK